MDFIDALRERRERLRERLERDPAFRELELVERLIAVQELDLDKSQPTTKDQLVKLSEAVMVPTPTKSPVAATKSAVMTKGRPVPFATTATGMHAVLDASEEYLRRRGKRAESQDIHVELVRLGILKAGAGDRSKVTSYLGRAKARFDNVRGEGYGLREWQTTKA